MNPRKTWKFVPAILAVALALPSPSLLACAACYGQSDSPMAQGMNWGIFSLLAVVVGVLGAIATFFVHIGRRSAAAGGANTPADEGLAPKG